MNLACQRRVRWSLVFLSVASLFSPASIAAAHNGQMRLALDARGNVAAYLVVFVLPEKPNVLEGALQRALGLPLTDVEWDIDDHKHVVSLYAHSARGFSHRDLIVQGRLSPEPLQELFRTLGIPSLSLNLSHPRCGLTSCRSGTQVLTPQLSANTEYVWDIPVDQTIAPLEFKYGYSWGNVAGVTGLLAALEFSALIGARLRRSAWDASPVRPPLLAQARRDILFFLILLWAVGVVAVYYSRADVLTWFLLNSDWDVAQSAIVLVLLWAPPLVVALLAFGRWKSKATLGQHGIESFGWFTARVHGSLLIPTMLIAVAMVDLRNTDRGRAETWLVLSICTALTMIATFIWVNAGKLGEGEQETLQAEAKDWKRLMRSRKSCAELLVVVCVPAVALLLVRQARLEDTSRYLVLLSVMIGVVLMLVIVANFLPFLGAKRRRKLLQKCLGSESGLPPGDDVEVVLLSPLNSRSNSDLAEGPRFAFCALDQDALRFLGVRNELTIRKEQIREVTPARSFLGHRGTSVRITYATGATADEHTIEIYPVGRESNAKTRQATERLLQHMRSWGRETLGGAGKEGEAPKAERLMPLIMIVLSGLMAWGLCWLLRFPFDLTRGDEGWAMFLMASTAAAFYWIPQTRRA